MAGKLNVVTNEAGARKRMAMSRNLGEDVIVGVHRLIRLTKIHDVDNEAFGKQLDQTLSLIGEYALQAGTDLDILFARKVILVGGQILKGSRGSYESATDLGEMLAWCGGSELHIDSGVNISDLREFADAVGRTLRSKKKASFRSPTNKIQLRQVSEQALIRGVDVERMSLEQRIVRTYASAVVVMRRFFEGLEKGSYVMPPQLKRVAQSLVDLSSGQTPAFLGVTDVRNQNHDHAGKAVNTAILAVLTARQLSNDRSTLSQIAMGALMYDSARPREAGSGSKHMGPVAARLTEDQEDNLPAGAAAVQTALGRVNAPTIARTVITYEALWLQRLDSKGPVHDGRLEPTIHARIVALSRRYNDMVTPEPGLAPPTPEKAIAQLANDLSDPADRTLLRALVSSLGLFPVGTVVKLSNSETAEVIAPLPNRSGPPLPRVRLVLDARGGVVTHPQIVDLSKPDPEHRGVVVSSVINTEGWSKALSAFETAQDDEPSSDSLHGNAQAAASPAPRSTETRKKEPIVWELPDDDEDDSEGAQSYVSGENGPKSLGWSLTPNHPAVDDAPVNPRPTVPAIPGRQHASPQPPKTSAPLEKPTDDDGDDLEDRTILQPSPFDVSENSGDEAPDDEAGTLFYVQGSGKESPHQSWLEQPASPPTAKGTFGHTPFVHILIYILDRTLSGTLVLRDPEGRSHGMTFAGGNITKTRTDHVIARLGDELVQQRLIQPVSLDAFVQSARKKKELLGQHLLRHRILTSNMLEDALRSQIVHRVEWFAKMPPQTEYSFYRHIDLLGDWGGNGVDTHPLINTFAAVRAWGDHEYIIEKLMRLGDAPIRLHPQADLSQLTLTEDEQRLLQRIRGDGTPLLDLYNQRLAEDPGISALLYLLLATRSLLIPGQNLPPLGVPPVAAPARDQADAPPSLRSAIVTPHPEETPPSSVSPSRDLDPDENSYVSYPSMATSPSAVVDALDQDIRETILKRHRARTQEEFVSQESSSVLREIPTDIRDNLPAPTARGSLGSTPVVHILTYMLDHHATGTVLLNEPDGTKHRVYFVHGAPAKIHVGHPVARLGELLVNSGQISRFSLEQTVDAAAEIEALLGEYLILENLAPRAAVLDALRKQIPLKLASLADAPVETTYSFYKRLNLLEGCCGLETFPTCPLDAILRVTRAWTDRTRIRGALKKVLDRKLRLHPDAHVDGLQLDTAERQVLEYIVQGTFTLRKLHHAGIGEQHVINSLVYALAITRQLAISSKAKPPMRPMHDSDEPSSAGFSPRHDEAKGAPSSSLRPGHSSVAPSSVGSLHKHTDLSRLTQPELSQDAGADDFAAAMQSLYEDDLEMALRYAQRAFAAAPRNSAYRAVLAWVRAVGPHESTNEAALAALDRILHDTPNCELALLFRARILDLEGRVEESLAAFETLLETNPEHPTAHQELAELQSRHGTSRT